MFGPTMRFATHFTPVMFGSRPEMMAGIMRALATRAARRRRVPPRSRAGFHGPCEGTEPYRRDVRGGADADRPARACPPRCRRLFARLTERWDGKGEPGTGQGRRDPAARAHRHVARGRRFQRTLGGGSSPRVICASVPAARSIRRSPTGSADDAGGILDVRSERVGVGGDARLRAAPADDPRGRGDRPCARGDGRLRRSRVALSGRSLGRRGGAPAAAARAAGWSPATSCSCGAPRWCTTSGRRRPRERSGRSRRRSRRTNGSG